MIFNVIIIILIIYWLLKNSLFNIIIIIIIKWIRNITDIWNQIFDWLYNHMYHGKIAFNLKNEKQKHY